ncbi:hypothetical protein [Mesorhizobium kowhaii]|nr:hypothetical protein [Mesorhizobium kowhaii]
MEIADRALLKPVVWRCGLTLVLCGRAVSTSSGSRAQRQWCRREELQEFDALIAVAADGAKRKIQRLRET